MFHLSRTTFRALSAGTALTLTLALDPAAHAQTITLPRNDVADDRSGLTYAFTNATLVIDPQTTVQNGTLLVRGATVQASGRDVPVPAGAVVVDLKGKYLYPALLDPYSDYGLPEVKRGERSFGRSQLESTKKGAYNWNQAIQPETDAAGQFTVNAARADELRKLGFGSVLSHLPDGIVRGSSVLVNLLDGREQDALVRGNVSAHYSFDKGSSTQDYPTSMMGSVALLRQTYYDAAWYKRAPNKTEYNLSLDRFNQLQGLPQVFEVGDKLGILRADKLGDEFGVQYVIKGTGDEYQLLDAVKATHAPLLVPIAFPQAYDVEDPYDALAVSLGELKHWEMAPANAGILAKAGVPFALTTWGLKDKKDFWPNLRKAIEYGLSEQTALAALTTAPAQFFKLDPAFGTLRPGAPANFLITSGNLFKADNVLYETWVKGRKYVVNDLNLSDLRGTYAFSLGDRTNLKLNVTGKALAPDVQVLANDTTKIPVKFSRVNDLLTLTFPLQRNAGDTRLSGYLTNGRTWKGDGLSPDGQPVKWQAVWQEFQEPAAKADSTKPVELGKMLYPFVGLGSETKPKMETILVKNATVWTNEKDGVLPNTDVLLQDGKIARVGKNLSATGARLVDGTGKHLTNGIFDEHSHIGLLSVNEGAQSVTSEVRMEDVVNSEDVNIYRQLAGGVTSAQLLHGSANSIGGQSVLIKLKWGETPDNLKIKGADGFIKFALGENVTRKNFQIPGAAPRYPISRMGVEQVMVDAFNRARAYETEWKTFNALPAKEKSTAVSPRRDLELDALVEILNSKRFITCHSYVQSEINMLMKVAERFGFRINTFTHILEGYKLADKMAKHGAGGSSFADWWAYKMEVKDAIPYNPALMHRVGVTVSINSDDAEMARRLNQEAAKSVEYGGLSEEDAWKMVTLNPAKLMHLDARLGSIRPGKDADVVLWNNNPLSIYARPEKTIIDGAVYFDLADDARRLEALDRERARLIQKMLKAKTGGQPVTKPDFRRQKMWHCEDVEGMYEEETEGRK